MSAIAIANRVGRTLVLPHLFGDLMQTTNEILTFNRVFDADHLVDALEGYVCFASFPTLENFEDYEESKVKILHHGSMESLGFYARLLEGLGEEKYVMLDRPVEELAQFPVNMMYLPEIAREIRNALRAAPEIRAVADTVVDGFESAGGGYLALHLRIEDDWKVHCEGQERAHFGGAVRMWWGVEEVAKKLDVFLEGEGGRNLQNIYIAVGNVDESVLGPLYALEAKHSMKIWRKGDVGRDLPHIVNAALDFEICTRANIFVGNR
jgi:hypothetical protein